MTLTPLDRYSNQSFLNTYRRNYITNLHWFTPRRHQIPLRQEESSQDRAKWMVMGSARLFFETTSNTLASLRLAPILYLVVAFLLLFTATGRTSTGCRVDNCINPYKRSNRRLEATEERSPFKADLSKRRCRIFSRLRRCLQKMHKACRGNLMFHSMKHMNDKNLDSFNCSAKPKTISPNIEPILPIQPDPETPSVNSTLSSTTAFLGKPTEGGACTFMGKPNYKHCGMFGDPHLRTFSDEFFTCKIEKTWPLIDNDYMVVMVTNVLVKEGSSATVTTKITVLIKPSGECAGQQHYIATSEQLSGAFTDGSSTTGSVTVVEVIPGRQVEIRARFIATTVIIRKVGRYLTFAIRMPKEYVNGLDEKTQLCTGGCPADHRIFPTKLKKGSSFNGNLHATFRSKSDETNSLENKDLGKSLDEGINSPEMLQNELSVRPSSSPSEPRQRGYTEKEARMKCKQIMLARTEVGKHSSSDAESQKDEVSDGDDKPHRLSTSQSSEAFSSLMPSSHRNSKKGRRRNRMAAAKRPEAEMSQSSFHQLFGEEKEAESPLARKSSAASRRNRKQKNKSKRHAQVDDDFENTGMSQESTPRVNKANSGSPPFNFYFESCVFDLLTTGDVNFTLAARAALEDVRRTHVLRGKAPGASLEVIKQWQPENFQETDYLYLAPEPAEDTTEGGKGAAGVISVSWSLMLCLILSCVYINSRLVSSSPTNTVIPSKQRILRTGTISFQHSKRTLILNNVEPVR